MLSNSVFRSAICLVSFSLLEVTSSNLSLVSTSSAVRGRRDFVGLGCPAFVLSNAAGVVLASFLGSDSLPVLRGVSFSVFSGVVSGTGAALDALVALVALAGLAAFGAALALTGPCFCISSDTYCLTDSIRASRTF